jgi:L-asparaginase II
MCYSRIPTSHVVDSQVPKDAVARFATCAKPYTRHFRATRRLIRAVTIYPVYTAGRSYHRVVLVSGTMLAYLLALARLATKGVCIRQIEFCQSRA